MYNTGDKMKLLPLYILIALLLSGCILKKEEPVDLNKRPNRTLTTRSFLTPATEHSSLYTLVSGRGERLQIGKDHKLRIRFYYNGDIPGQKISMEKEITVGYDIKTVGDLFAQIKEFAQTIPKKIIASFDTLDPGRMNIHTGPDSIYNLSIDNLSIGQGESDVQLYKTFFWDDFNKGAVNVSVGYCMEYAFGHSDLFTMRDTLGYLLGFEPGDSIRVSGENKGEQFGPSSILIDSSGATLGDVVGLIQGASGFNTQLSQEKDGAITINVPEYLAGSDKITVLGINASGGQYLYPTNFTTAAVANLDPLKM